MEQEQREMALSIGKQPVRPKGALADEIPTDVAQADAGIRAYIILRSVSLPKDKIS